MKSCHKKRARMHMQVGGYTGLNKPRDQYINEVLAEPARALPSGTAAAAPAPVAPAKTTADILRDAQAASAEAKAREAALYAEKPKKKKNWLGFSKGGEVKGLRRY